MTTFSAFGNGKPSGEPSNGTGDVRVVSDKPLHDDWQPGKPYAPTDRARYEDELVGVSTRAAAIDNALAKLKVDKARLLYMGTLINKLKGTDP